MIGVFLLFQRLIATVIIMVISYLVEAKLMGEHKPVSVKDTAITSNEIQLVIFHYGMEFFFVFHFVSCYIK